MTRNIGVGNSSAIGLTEASAPVTPASGRIELFCDVADHKVSYKDSAGAVYKFLTDIPITAKGSLIVGDAGGVPVELVRGVSGDFLFITGSTVQWGSPLDYGLMTNPLEAKGDLPVGLDSAGHLTNLHAGSARQILTVDSTTFSGLRWQAVLTALGSQTVGTSPVTIAHGLSYTPTIVLWTPTSAGQIWQSTAPDATNIYLTADAAGRTATVFVR